MAEECYNQYFEGKDLSGATERHEHTCHLSDEDHAIFESLIFDCMRDDGIHEKIPEMLKLVEAYKQDPEAVLDQISKENIECSEEVLGI